MMQIFTGAFNAELNRLTAITGIPNTDAADTELFLHCNSHLQSSTSWTH